MELKRPNRNTKNPITRSTQGFGPRGVRWVTLVGGVLVAIAVVIWGIVRWGDNPLQTKINHQDRLQLSTVRESLARGEYELTLQLADELLQQTPDSFETLLAAAEAAAQLGQVERAIAYCDRVPAGVTDEAITAMWIPCELTFRQGELRQSELRLQRLLALAPQHVDARRRMIYILGLAGRRWEAEPHLMSLVRQGQFDFESLLFLGNGESVVDFSTTLSEYAAQSPQDPLPPLGLARIAIKNNDLVQAKQLLKGVLLTAPELSEAQARMGEVLLANQQWQELQNWHTGLPVSAEVHPEIWAVRGLIAEQLGDPRAAQRSFWEALRRDPDHRVSLYQLAKLCRENNQLPEADLYLQRHAKLTEFMRVVDGMYATQPTRDELQQAAELAGSLGRWWESWGWYSLLLSTGATPGGAPLDNDVAKANYQRLQAYLAENDPPRVLVSKAPASWSDMSSYPLLATSAWPVDRVRDASTAAERGVESRGADGVKFVEESALRGMNFQYFCDSNPDREGKRIYEFAGGGAGVIDFDCDGWPDAYWTQGCPWPPTREPAAGDSAAAVAAYHNRLYRNLGADSYEGGPSVDKSFIDVSQASGSSDLGFGQGISVGDFNGDGFADLYVANIGQNCLLQNNGDGTFSDVTDASGLNEHRWTTSCVVVDLNDDGLPDLYDANYLKGDDLFERICTWDGGKKRICGPATFQPEDDDVWLNLGDGRFENVSQEAGIRLAGGNGLGLIAGDFDGSGRVQLFVANDQTANYFFVNKASPGERPQFVDRAPLRGLAYDRDGLAQACMGVAAGDISGDGYIDLFITNYYRESNTLYVRDSAGNYVDRARVSGLRDPSFSMLGFGTQFIDADLDGELDLILTNGHLDDFTYLNEPYRMRPQFFHNRGAGQFEEQMGTTLGPFFEGEYRGRGLARWDWNRDGKQDVLISHLDAPSALLTNRTERVGHHIALEFVATGSNRDAIGTRWVVSASDEKKIHGQLTAGDGYQASNQRQWIGGLGEEKGLVDVTIYWPSGRVQALTGLLPDTSWLMVEDHQPVERDR